MPFVNRDRENMRRIFARVPRNLHTQVKIEAARRGVPMAELVALAVRRELGEQPADERDNDNEGSADAA